jgi:hypothetical protein
MGRNLIILLVVAAIILQACTERIDIQTDEEFQKLAVEGYISPDTQYIVLTETSGYFSQQAPPPVTDALVTVTTEDGQFQFSETSEFPGSYFPPDDFIVKSTSTYQLSIELTEEIGGESFFEAEASMPIPSDQVDSIDVLFQSDFNTWVVALYAYEPAGTHYYAFSTSVNGTPITDSLSRIVVRDDSFVDNRYLFGIWVGFLFEDEVQVGDTVVLATTSITEDYYRYLSEAQTELSPNNPLFSGPPANVRSNISNGAVGYFAVFSSASVSTIVTEKEE